MCCEVEVYSRELCGVLCGADSLLFLNIIYNGGGRCQVSGGCTVGLYFFIVCFIRVSRVYRLGS